jgi:hypothetical protein
VKVLGIPDLAIAIFMWWMLFLAKKKRINIPRRLKFSDFWFKLLNIKWLIAKLGTLKGVFARLFFARLLDRFVRCFLCLVDRLAFFIYCAPMKGNST